MEQLHGVQRRLVAVEHDQRARCEPVELAAQLGADRAAGAGDQHPLAGQVAGDGVDVGVDLAPAEQVGLGERPDVGQADRAVEQLARPAAAPRRRARPMACRDRLAEQLGVAAGDGDDEPVRRCPRPPASVVPPATRGTP